jgi:hypothetical protein
VAVPWLGGSHLSVAAKQKLPLTKKTVNKRKKKSLLFCPIFMVSPIFSVGYKSDEFP